MLSARLACIIMLYRVRRRVVTEMPMLEPMLRIRLKKAVPCVRNRGARVEKVVVLSGTKTSPRPKPWTKPVRIMAARDTSGVKPAIS